MRTKWKTAFSGALLMGIGTAVAAGGSQLTFLTNLQPFKDATGILETFNTTGKVDLTGPFFQSLGTNGRSCATCHQPANAWTISAEHVAKRFDDSAGLDPIFRTNDGSNCDVVDGTVVPGTPIDTSTLEARRTAYSLLTSKGLIRIALPMPANAEFTVVSVSNPYGCNNTTTLSMYRRPLPSTNLRFLSTLMWDGRESSMQTGTKPILYDQTNPQGNLLFDLRHQSDDATTGHAQGASPSPLQRQQIVDFEMALTTAQAVDSVAGALSRFKEARGGPVALANQPFCIGINDNLAPNDCTPHSFTPIVFTLFTQSWVDAADDRATKAARASILRGQTLFNSKPLHINGVAGLPPSISQPFDGTCGTCHDTINVGNHSVSAPLNIGVGDQTFPSLVTNPLDLSYLPQITLQKNDTGQRITTTDPGRALITGKWADIGKLKGPILRGLAARAPYFHNGSAANLKDVVKFYNARFLNPTDQLDAGQQADLVAFLAAL